MVCMCDIHTTQLVSLGVSVNVQGFKLSFANSRNTSSKLNLAKTFQYKFAKKFIWSSGAYFFHCFLAISFSSSDKLKWREMVIKLADLQTLLKNIEEVI